MARSASANCDTEDGPAVTDGRLALETGDPGPALAWVHAEGDAEVREVFGLAQRVRAPGGEARLVADRLFLETLVRLHRAGEGAGFEGIKPAGQVDPVVVVAAAADRSIEAGPATAVPAGRGGMDPAGGAKVQLGARGAAQAAETRLTRRAPTLGGGLVD